MGWVMAAWLLAGILVGYVWCMKREGDRSVSKPAHRAPRLKEGVPPAVIVRRTHSPIMRPITVHPADSKEAYWLLPCSFGGIDTVLRMGRFRIAFKDDCGHYYLCSSPNFLASRGALVLAVPVPEGRMRKICLVSDGRGNPYGHHDDMRRYSLTYQGVSLPVGMHIVSEVHVPSLVR